MDGAHNPAAADMLEDSVRKYFKGRKMYFIMGVFRDKDYSYIIRKGVLMQNRLLRLRHRITHGHRRRNWQKPCGRAIHVQAAENIQDAVNKVFAMAEREDLILLLDRFLYRRDTTLVKPRKKNWHNDWQECQRDRYWIRRSYGFLKKNESLRECCRIQDTYRQEGTGS